jgi:hypothetical protein
MHPGTIGDGHELAEPLSMRSTTSGGINQAFPTRKAPTMRPFRRLLVIV